MEKDKLARARAMEGLDLTVVTSAQRSLEDAVRQFVTPDVLAAFGSFTRQQDALRHLLTSIEGTASLPALLSEPSLLRDVGTTGRLVESLQADFRLPAIAEISRLAADFATNPAHTLFAEYIEDTSALARAMEQMRTPWMDPGDSLRSVTGFAELHGIGNALGSVGSFDAGLTAALRSQLGDWRDPISWRPDILTDRAVRSDFYAELGFNHALTAFPAPAFEEALDISGLGRERPPLIVRYGPPVPSSPDDDREEEFARANMAHDWLQRLESQLRAFIDEQMTRTFGADWPKRRLPNGMYDQWQEKKRKAQQAGAAEWPLIAYADFADYAPVICRGDNWREVFAAFFRRPESVRESFQRLYPVRLDTMHARPITQDDELLLYVEARRLTRMILGQ